MNTQHTPGKCTNCDMQLDKDGGCYNPYCCDPAVPQRTPEQWNCGGLDYCPECGATGDYAALKQQHSELLTDKQPKLTVKLRSLPESNGKRNWTATLCRVEQWNGLVGSLGGITVAHGELWNRVAYAAECAKYLIGERDTAPYILNYGDDIETPDQWKGEVIAKAGGE